MRSYNRDTSALRRMGQARIRSVSPFPGKHPLRCKWVVGNVTYLGAFCAEAFNRFRYLRKNEPESTSSPFIVFDRRGAVGMVDRNNSLHFQDHLFHRRYVLGGEMFAGNGCVTLTGLRSMRVAKVGPYQMYVTQDAESHLSDPVYLGRHLRGIRRNVPVI